LKHPFWEGKHARRSFRYAKIVNDPEVAGAWRDEGRKSSTALQEIKGRLHHSPNDPEMASLTGNIVYLDETGHGEPWPTSFATLAFFKQARRWQNRIAW